MSFIPALLYGSNQALGDDLPMVHIDDLWIVLHIFQIDIDVNDFFFYLITEYVGIRQVQ